MGFRVKVQELDFVEARWMSKHDCRSFDNPMDVLGQKVQELDFVQSRGMCGGAYVLLHMCQARWMCGEAYVCWRVLCVRAHVCWCVLATYESRDCWQVQSFRRIPSPTPPAPVFNPLENQVAVKGMGVGVGV